jgi:hypothetical protein
MTVIVPDMSQAFIGEFISPPTLKFLATNLHNKILQEYKTRHTN